MRLNNSPHSSRCFSRNFKTFYKNVLKFYLLVIKISIFVFEDESILFRVLKIKKKRYEFILQM